MTEEKMDKFEFEKEVLIRLTKIETKLDDYKNIKAQANDAFNLSKNNDNRIKKIEDNQRWIVLAILGTVIGGIMKLLIN